MNKTLFSLLFIFISFISWSQTAEVQVMTSGTKTSLRGLSVVNDNIIWASGSNGIVGRSTNGGKNWKWTTIKGYDSTEFRDIEGFDGQTAIVMASGAPAYILKTTDGGETWKQVYVNKDPAMFLDAMDFVDQRHGIVVGDPINKKVFLAETRDGGETWREMPTDKRPDADSGEAFFAASGTNIRLYENNNFYIVSGGTKSRVFSDDKEDIYPIPIIQGKESTGANSIAVYDDGKLKGSKRWVVVGGDFTTPASTDKNCFYTTNGGKTWNAPSEPPHGYRSCVEYLAKFDLLSCGINGVDHSADGGKTWRWISKEGFNVCRIAEVGTSIFLAGNNGKIGKIVWK